jgi:hypothetical protein
LKIENGGFFFSPPVGTRDLQALGRAFRKVNTVSSTRRRESKY